MTGGNPIMKTTTRTSTLIGTGDEHGRPVAEEQ
jgi:hypothetical protein